MKSNLSASKCLIQVKYIQPCAGCEYVCYMMFYKIPHLQIYSFAFQINHLTCYVAIFKLTDISLRSYNSLTNNAK